MEKRKTDSTSVMRAAFFKSMVVNKLWLLHVTSEIWTPVLVEKHVPGSYEKARLRFAHAETVVPFSCLLGLFLEGSGK